MEEFARYFNIVNAIVPIVGTTGHATTATAVDGRGYGRAAFIVQLGSRPAEAILEMQAAEAATSTGATSVITGSKLTNVTSAGASKIYCIDVPVNSAKPFLKLRGTSGTAGHQLVSAICVLYRGNKQNPVTWQSGQYLRKGS
jgi:hypothetical protein